MSTSTFDLDAYREAHRPWTFRAGGFAFEARILSAEHVRRFNAELAGADAAGQRAALARLLRAAFPWRFSYRWRGDPVTRILALEPAALDATLSSFFEWVRQTHGARVTSPATDGTPSRAPILERTA